MIEYLMWVSIIDIIVMGLIGVAVVIAAAKLG